MKTDRVAIFLLAGLGLASLPFPAVARAADSTPGTPAELVKTYANLADGILALKRTEEDLCRSILAAAGGKAEAELGMARKAMAAGDAKASQAALEALAANVGHLATEGDTAVGAVRKKLLDGGHHHNAAGETQGIFDEGFVIVTRAAKVKLLESSRSFGQMARAPKAEAVEAEWKKVEAVLAELLKPGK